MLNPWLQFIICAVIIVLAGSRLTKSVTVAAENSATFSLTYRAKKEIARIGYDVLLVLAGYNAVVYLLFKSGGN